MEHPSKGMGKNEIGLIPPHTFQAVQGTPWGKAGQSILEMRAEMLVS